MPQPIQRVLSSFALATLSLLASKASRADVIATPAVQGVVEAGNASPNYSASLRMMDLGIVWVDGAGRTLLAYGDAYTSTSNNACFWTRGGTLAWTNDGLTFSWPTQPNPTQNLLGSTLSIACPKANFDDPQWYGPNASYGMINPPLPSDHEFDALPSAGVSVNGKDIVHYFAIPDNGPDPNDPTHEMNGWCNAGFWTTAFSAFAERPTGTNVQFTRNQTAMRFSSTSNFALAAFLPWGEYVYLFGTPAGRSGAIKLARAFATEASDPGGYLYWDGTTWQNDETKGVYVAPAPAGELSVQFDSARGRFLMVYLDQSTGRLVLRDAPSIEGPYTEEKTLLLSSVYGGAYGGFMYPLNGGSTLKMNVSEWNTYDVYQFTSSLSWRAQVDNLVTDGNFEQPSGFLPAPWAPSCISTGSGTSVCTNVTLTGSTTGPVAAHSGSIAAVVPSTDTAWHDVHQTVAVKPNTDYQVSFWALGRHVTNAYFGARTAGAPTAGTSCGGLTEASDSHTPAQELHFVSPPANWEQYTVRFNSGPRSLIQIYAGFVGDGAADGLYVDDVSLMQLELTRDGGFEMQGDGTVGWPYAVEGPGGHGVDQAMGNAHTGRNNGWMNTTGSNEWNAITQVVGVQPNTTYTVKAWVKTSAIGAGYFGVRAPNGTIVGQTQYGASLAGFTQLSVTVSSGSNTQLKIFAGYWSTTHSTYPTQYSWVRVDDISIEQPAPIVLHAL